MFPEYIRTRSRSIRVGAKSAGRSGPTRRHRDRHSGTLPGRRRALALRAIAAERERERRPAQLPLRARPPASARSPPKGASSRALLTSGVQVITSFCFFFCRMPHPAPRRPRAAIPRKGGVVQRNDQVRRGDRQRASTSTPLPQIPRIVRPASRQISSRLPRRRQPITFHTVPRPALEGGFLPSYDRPRAHALTSVSPPQGRAPRPRGGTAPFVRRRRGVAD